MELLRYDVLKKAGYAGYLLEDAPVRALQFGEGNFLRAFVDVFFDLMNEKGGFHGKVMPRPAHCAGPHCGDQRAGGVIHPLSARQ